MTVEVFPIYVDDAGDYFCHLQGGGHEAINVTLSGVTATVGSPFARNGELLPLSIDENGHLFVHEAGRWAAVGTDHGVPTRGIYSLATNGAGNLLAFIKGQWVKVTYNA